ncbi:MAG: YdcF family protein [Sedimenticola sp.]
MGIGDAVERDLMFMALAKQYPEAKLIFTGGASSMIYQEYKAADVARRLFSEQGIDLSRIIFERGSRNTWENAVLSSIEQETGSAC